MRAMGVSRQAQRLGHYSGYSGLGKEIRGVMDLREVQTCFVSGVIRRVAAWVIGIRAPRGSG
jgi:hypothetical protein